MAQVSGKTILPLLGLAGIAFFAVAVFVSRDLGDAARANRARLTDAGVQVVPDSMRVAYLEANARVDDFEVGPELKPGTDEPVPGLLKVSGTLKNIGDKVVADAHLMVFTRDEAGKVLSSFQHNVLVRGRLEPGGARPFAFRIPSKPEYRDFDYVLR